MSVFLFTLSFFPDFFLLSLTDYRGSGAVILDDCNFHESVHLDSFDIDRTLSLVSAYYTSLSI